MSNVHPIRPEQHSIRVPTLPFPDEFAASAERMQKLVDKLNVDVGEDGQTVYRCSCGRTFGFLTSLRLHEIMNGHNTVTP